jgi:hypothetical protein
MILRQTAEQPRLKQRPKLAAENARIARERWPGITRQQLFTLAKLTHRLRVAVHNNELILLANSWYVSHSGLLRIADRRHCFGIHTEPVLNACDPANSRWIFKATAFKSATCMGFTGYGDADPSNVSPLVHGAEMRVAETRAVNRALRKAYGIGVCSVEEIGSSATVERPIRKAPPKPVYSNGSNGRGSNGNGNGSRLRDRLCQLIRQHNLDAELVKSYATDFCGTKSLRDATREHVENFVAHLADWAEKDRSALLCRLNSYARRQGGAA